MKKILLGFIAIGLLTFVGCGTSSSVKIGEQEWMTKNLNLDHFQNGDIIQEAKTKEEWEKVGKNKEPAWCHYNNNSSAGEKYGKLYNFYAVTDPRGLVPNGWHVPTDAEWTVLTDYLAANGHSGTEGAALKSTSGWDIGGNGTDDYGWLGLPGGNRNAKYGCFFSAIRLVGSFWSSSQSNTGSAWFRSLRYYADSLARSSASMENGFSVRCLRD